MNKSVKINFDILTNFIKNIASILACVVNNRLFWELFKKDSRLELILISDVAMGFLTKLLTKSEIFMFGACDDAADWGGHSALTWAVLCAVDGLAYRKLSCKFFPAALFDFLIVMCYLRVH